MQRAQVAHLKAHLSKYLADVRDGDTVVVYDRNTPIARVIPFREDSDGFVVHEPARPPRHLKTVRGVATRRSVDVVRLLRASCDSPRTTTPVPVWSARAGSLTWACRTPLNAAPGQVPELCSTPDHRRPPASRVAAGSRRSQSMASAPTSAAAPALAYAAPQPAGFPTWSRRPPNTIGPATPAR